MTVLSSFTGIVIEVLFFIHRINWNGDIRDPARNDRPAVCEISHECYKEINGTLGDEKLTGKYVLTKSCLQNNNNVDADLDFAILNKL